MLLADCDAETVRTSQNRFYGYVRIAFFKPCEDMRNNRKYREQRRNDLADCPGR